MLRALIYSNQTHRLYYITQFRREFLKRLSRVAQRVVITVKVRDVLGSSPQAHQHLLFFKENIKGQKDFF